MCFIAWLVASPEGGRPSGPRMLAARSLGPTKMASMPGTEKMLSVENADSIFSVPGIDAIFVGPNDLAASMRGPDGRPPSGEATSQAMKHILATCKKYSVPAGVHCYTPEEARAR